MQSKKHKVVTLGEVLMRLMPPDYQKYNQANSANIHFGGTEANVAIALSHLSCVCVHVTSLPDDFIGESVTGFLKKNNVDTQHNTFNSNPLGLYFMEQGAVHRSSRISYNRNYSAFSKIKPEDFNWDEILEGADWFHWTGITPAISKDAYLVLKEALELANKKNITVSTDPVYRSNLWKYDANPTEILKELASLSQVFIGGPEEVNLLFNTNYTYNDFKESADFLMEKLPNIKHIIHKTRIAKNASSHSISSEYYNGTQHYKTDAIEITHVIDRIGTGDAFAAGLIYGMLTKNNEKALAYANTLSALKHTIPGDVSLISEEELNQAVDSNLNARIIR
ncbi:2-dehydro-3-deoxygluconokinase [Mesonia phycicola]|uniref:2-dehydro-3-deoxygluconokinase n=1 Tax=Mesonia phycicola TaxID=579105 RepID=A0A1M6H0E4_9FLAO|nr:sugar kinase [Mesonia phycicola]SHJ15709.1 2-dehydro-3-deoxygluconokinase [Mesonia phycicola]